MAVDKYLYNFPVIGSLLVKISVYKLTYIISLATTSGLTFKHIVRLMIDSADNAYLRKELIDFGEQIRMGETVSNAIERETLLPKNFRVMFSTGYEVGAVIKTMQVLEYYFEHEIDYTIDSLTDLIEPFLFIFLAVVVGGILVSVLLPIYSIMMSLG
jgi:type IV pilus assembly protein PilC